MTRRLVIVIFLLLSVHICRAQDNGTMARARRYEPLILAAAVKYRVDPRLLWTVAWLESRFRHYDERGRIITSAAGAKGVMQFMPRTADRYGWRDEHNAAQAIDAAARYLHDLQGMFNYRLDQVLAAYNAGEGAVEAFNTGRKLPLSNGKVINPRGIKSDIPPYRETARYVTDGIAVFRRLTAAKYFSAPHLAQLQTIETPKEEVAIITVDLEEMPEDLIELKRGSLYAVDAGDRLSRDPSLPKNSKTQSVYSH